MKRFVILLIFFLFSNYCLFGQTDIVILDEYNNVSEWQTPHSQIDSILNSDFDGGIKNFLEIIYKNIRLESRHQDNWVQNYLVEIEVSNKEVIINFRNSPLKTDKEFITNAIEKTAPYWKNQEIVRIKFLISSDVRGNFNKSFSEAFIKIDVYRMIGISNCNIEDECLFESKELLDFRIGDLHRLEEIEVVIYYLKILARRFPFDKEINMKLWDLINQKIEN